MTDTFCVSPREGVDHWKTEAEDPELLLPRQPHLGVKTPMLEGPGGWGGFSLYCEMMMWEGLPGLKFYGILSVLDRGFN